MNPAHKTKQAMTIYPYIVFDYAQEFRKSLVLKQSLLSLLLVTWHNLAPCGCDNGHLPIVLRLLASLIEIHAYLYWEQEVI